ncbi:hypothetical protein [Xanthomonas sp. 3307]|uniref:hypothetical protein n=1 Tax=Xanthomonas sp. 3307 TaxID=3035316 RepID=UPI0016124A77|nr:hypothetical protein [Xanthomonas sp. 3307]MBB5943788.1 hypothetical protein [Xanthomonas sp. 3307]
MRLYRGDVTRIGFVITSVLCLCLTGPASSSSEQPTAALTSLLEVDGTVEKLDDEKRCFQNVNFSVAEPALHFEDFSVAPEAICVVASRLDRCSRHLRHMDGFGKDEGLLQR